MNPPGPGGFGRQGAFLIRIHLSCHAFSWVVKEYFFEGETALYPYRDQAFFALAKNEKDDMRYGSGHKVGGQAVAVFVERWGRQGPSG